MTENHGSGEGAHRADFSLCSVMCEPNTHLLSTNAILCQELGEAQTVPACTDHCGPGPTPRDDVSASPCPAHYPVLGMTTPSPGRLYAVPKAHLSAHAVAFASLGSPVR